MQAQLVARVALAVLVATTARAHAEPSSAGEEAEGPETISLAQLVKLAVQQSPTLALARAKRRLAELGETIAGAPDEWQVRTSVNVSKRAEDPIPNARAQVISSTEVLTRLDLGKRLFTGGDVALSVSSSEQSRRFGEAPNDPASANVSVAAISVRQPLLRGFGGGARINQQKAALVADAATLAAMDAGASTLRELVTSYWTVAFARATLNVRLQSQKLAKEQHDLTQKMHQRGAVPDGALKAAAYGLALREEATLRAHRDLENASMMLRRLAGLELGPDQIELVPTDPILAVDRRTWEMDDVLTTAIARNPRIAAARLGVELAEVEVRVRSNAMLPNVDVNASAGAVGVGSGIAGSIDSLGSVRSYQVSAGVSLNWEIGGAARAAAKASRIERTTAKRSVKDVERDVIASVVLSVHEIRAARKRIEVASRAIELAQSNFATEQALFRADRSSNVVVFERQTELDEARLLEARAAIEYRIAITTVEYLTGDILESYGVEVVATRK